MIMLMSAVFDDREQRDRGEELRVDRQRADLDDLEQRPVGSASVVGRDDHRRESATTR